MDLDKLHKRKQLTTLHIKHNHPLTSEGATAEYDLADFLGAVAKRPGKASTLSLSSPCMALSSARELVADSGTARKWPHSISKEPVHLN